MNVYLSLLLCTAVTLPTINGKALKLYYSFTVLHFTKEMLLQLFYFILLNFMFLISLKVTKYYLVKIIKTLIWKGCWNGKVLCGETFLITTQTNVHKCKRVKCGSLVTIKDNKNDMRLYCYEISLLFTRVKIYSFKFTAKSYCIVSYLCNFLLWKGTIIIILAILCCHFPVQKVVLTVFKKTLQIFSCLRFTIDLLEIKIGH